MVTGVSTAELATWLEGRTTEQPLLLDVRAAAEFDVSHLPGALPAPSVGQALDLIQARPTAGPVVLYCSVGYRSADLAAQLQAHGLTNLYNLEGSIFQWAKDRSRACIRSTRIGGGYSTATGGRIRLRRS